ncbi:MAG TPA: MarR family transcriptional regulator [Flavobacteriales bacterium]|nr:MarR family transcriptional regulator [Flavobacteriales bacterium]HAP70286.1 MarR family transcriptional regulator [Flavobacteriales bacterium]
MKLEDEIRQDKGFKSQQQKAMVNIFYTEGWLRNRLSETLKPHDLTSQQYNVLRILRGSNPKPMSTSCVRSRMLDKMSDVSRIVDRLFKKALVDKQVCSTDKRLVDVFITEAGLTVLDKIDESVDGMDKMFTSITDEEAATLNEILDKLRD